MKLIPSRFGRFLRLGLVAVAATAGMGMGTAYADEDVKILRPNGSPALQFGAAVAMDGNFLLVGAPDSLASNQNRGAAFLYDVSDPESPVLVTDLKRAVEVPFDRFGIAVALSGNLALVGAPRGSAVYLFDLTTPGNYVQRAKLRGNGFQFGRAIALKGNLAVVAGGLDGTRIYDVSNQSAPSLKSVILNTQYSGNSSSVAIDGDKLIVGYEDEATGLWNQADTGGARLYDISDLDNPVELAAIYPDPGVWSGEFGSAVAIRGNHLFIGESGYESGVPPNLDRRGAVSAYDISDPANPVRKSRILATPLLRINNGESLSLVGNELLVGGGENGFEVGQAILYDVSDLAAPVEITRFEPSDPLDPDRARGFGYAVAYNGITAVMGAPFDTEAGVSGDIGSTNVFGVNPVGFPNLADTSDTGRLNSDNITQETLPTFDGLAMPGTSVELFSDVAGSLGSTTAGSGGTWSITQRRRTGVPDHWHQQRARHPRPLRAPRLIGGR